MRLSPCTSKSSPAAPARPAPDALRVARLPSQPLVGRGVALRSRPSLAGLALAILSMGCSSSPATPAETATGTLVVVGLSLRDQAPLPVKGVLHGDVDTPFDTRRSPAGQTFENLPAGHYRIEITHRYAGDREVAASVRESADVRRGQSTRCEVVVDDRDEALR